MPRSRSSPPASNRTFSGTKNSFPGPTAQSDLQTAEQTSSTELGNAHDLPPVAPEAGDDQSEGVWIEPSRTRSGRKSSTGPREPRQDSQQSVKSRKISFPKDFALDEDEADEAQTEVVNVADSSSDFETPPARKRSKLPRKAKDSKAFKRPHDTLPYPEANQFVRAVPDVGARGALPDYAEFGSAKPKTLKSLAMKMASKSKPTIHDTLKSKRCVKSDEEEQVQGCAPPPRLNDASSDDSDGDRQIKSRKQAPRRLVKPAHSLQHVVRLSVHQSADDGSCEFDSLSSSLCYLLEHHPNSFNFGRFPQSRKTIQAFFDHRVLRNALVDHLLLVADSEFDNLGGLTPRDAIKRDYIDDQQLLHDPEWAERTGNPPGTHQQIHSFQQYTAAMRQPCANGDEIMLAMFCDLFNLRVIVAEITAASSSEQQESDEFILATISLDITPALPLSSDFTVILILSSLHYDWAHLSSGSCSDPTSHCRMGSARQVICHTNSPVEQVDRNPDYYTPVCQELLLGHHKNLRRAAVRSCLVDEHNAIPSEADLTINTFERLGGISSMHTLPELLHLHSATTYKPQAHGDASHYHSASHQAHPALCRHHAHSDHCSHTRRPHPPESASSSEIPQSPVGKPQSRHVQANDVKRAHSALEQAVANLCEHPTTVAEVPTDLKYAAGAVQTVTGCDEKTAIESLNNNRGTDTNYFRAMMLSCGQLAPQPVTVPAAAQQPPQAPQTFNTEVTFVEQHLGEGVREMTQAEIAAADLALSKSKGAAPAVPPPLSALVPKNLNSYWQHHQAAVAATPRGSMTLEQHAAIIRRAASNSLHYEACDAAAAKRARDLWSHLPAAALHNDPDFQTPGQHATHATVAASRPPITTATPAAQTNYQTHCSPAVRMAASRAEQAQSARSNATTVVVMASNSSKLLQWKAGEERDCKGFYWSTKLAVQQAWEQYNTAEDVSNYRTFKSAIHCTMVPIICAELTLTRAQFEKVSDAELIDSIDKKLKPSGPADYLIKMRQIKFDTAEPAKASLLHRYRAFAEPFLQLLAEASEAGCPINEESSKLAFKEQCRGSQLMMMWLQEERWTTATAAHHRIMTHLKNYNTLVTLQSLNGNGFPQPQAPAVQVQQQQAQLPQIAPVAPQQVQQMQQQAQQQAAPQQSPMPYYSPQQRADYKRQKAAVQLPFQPQAPQAPAPPAAFQQQLNPLFHQQLLVNNQIASPPPAAPALYIQPGLDQRGPNWHPIGAKCRYSPCTSLFCQGCGEHGHATQDCRKRGKHANWNYSGYYAEQRPGQAHLIYDGPARPQPQFPAAAPPGTIPHPPAQTPAAPPVFPTPYVQAGRPVPPAAAPARTYTPVIRNNAAVQHPEAGGAAAEQQ